MHSFEVEAVSTTNVRMRASDDFDPGFDACHSVDLNADRKHVILKERQRLTESANSRRRAKKCSPANNLAGRFFGRQGLPQNDTGRCCHLNGL